MGLQEVRIRFRGCLVEGGGWCPSHNPSCKPPICLGYNFLRSSTTPRFVNFEDSASCLDFFDTLQRDRTVLRRGTTLASCVLWRWHSEHSEHSVKICCMTFFRQTSTRSNQNLHRFRVFQKCTKEEFQPELCITLHAKQCALNLSRLTSKPSNLLCSMHLCIFLFIARHGFDVRHIGPATIQGRGAWVGVLSALTLVPAPKVVTCRPQSRGHHRKERSSQLGCFRRAGLGLAWLRGVALRGQRLIIREAVRPLPAAS